MRTSFITFVYLLCFGFICRSQSNPFHTLTLPSQSPLVTETQKLGVTDISISYHSPALRDRDVWNDPNIIPQNGDPIPWRAGANMNTTIFFSTDVFINDKKLTAGTYGFHVIPKGETYTLLFAHESNQWGSYYLDVDKDVSLSVDVKAVACEASEQLDYEFLNRTENSVTIGLEWGERRLPFKVSVDLNSTVVEGLRSELRGINTYRWEAWNDAASWCLQHNTNLDEALEWVNRSINGGYNGFAANKNITNLTTKARILKQLNKIDELKATVNDAMNVNASAYEFNGLIIFLLQNELYNKALAMSDAALNQYPETWYLYLNKAICQYYTKKKSSKTFKLINKALENAPEAYKARIKQISEAIKNDTYKI